jgi:GNAT superfamily N-acetyltransferase
MHREPVSTIRAYHDGDAAGVRACIVDLQEFERQIDERLRPGEAIAADYLDQMIDRCRECAGTILVLECDGMIVGFATVLTRVPFEELDDPPGEYALVSDLAVRTPFRGRGFGAALLAEAERRARTAGAAELRIAALSSNPVAGRLYRRSGFEPYLEVLSKRLRPAGT